jgi:hypothetical protein
VGRDTAEDRRQLDEIAGLASNFARLTDPRALRIAKAVVIAAPTNLMPPTLVQRAKELSWLELESPDFAVLRSSQPGPRTARVELGVDPKAGLVEIAVVDDASAPARINESSAVLQLLQYMPVDGFLVPKKILVWLPELGQVDVPLTNVSLRAQQAMDMYVRKASLRADLKPQDFLP